MSIQQSIDFLSDVSHDDELRGILNGLSPQEIPIYLQEFGYEFTADEFEESINLLHVKCQFYEQAERLFEVVNWYRVLIAQN